MQGLDIGTAFIVAVKATDKKQSRVSTVRDCFLALETEQAPALELSGVEFIEGSKGIYVVGTEAVTLAGALGGELRRPLSNGFVSPKEEDGKEILQLILQQVLGDPTESKELVAFSVPGPVFDVDAAAPPKNDMALTFHTNFFRTLLTQMGYEAKPLNEAVAVCYNETMLPKKGDAPLTGLAISFGAGTTNVALCYKSLPLRTFALPFGGDYIDQFAAKATNSTVSHITLLKERGVNLVTKQVVKAEESDDTQTARQAEAIADGYTDLLTKLVVAINKYFSFGTNRVEIPETIPVIFSGGTSMSPGFTQLFSQVFMKELDVRFKVNPEPHPSQSPLDATAMGCLNYIKILQRKREEKEAKNA